MDRTFRLCSTTLLALAFASLGARADVTADWTSHAVAATQVAQQSPEDAARSLKLVKEAMAAAAGPSSNGNGNGNGHTDGLGSKTERDDAAVAVAAFAVLETLYPDQREGLDARLAVTFANIPETDAKAEGAAAGRRIATELLRAGR